jgi:integrase
VTLLKRGNIFWSYFYIDGVREQHSTGTRNRRLAESIERKLKEDANLRRHRVDAVNVDPNMTFGEIAARFIANAGPKPFHLDRLKHLLPYFADMPVRCITKGSVREYRGERLRKKAITDATLNRDAAVLRHIFYWAVEEGLLIANPLSRLRLVRERRVKRSVLSLIEEDALLGVAPEHLQRMIVAALYAGLRRGEVLHQRWEDIDFDRRVLSVTRSKTPEGESREIPLAGKLLDLLLPIRQARGLVFTFRGQGIADYKTAWNRAAKTALTRHFRFHELRHTFNTRLMEAGVIQDVRKALMGHSPGRDVNAIYTHVEMPVKRDAIRKLETWVEAERTKQQNQPQNEGERNGEPEPNRIHGRESRRTDAKGLPSAGGSGRDQAERSDRLPLR